MVSQKRKKVYVNNVKPYTKTYKVEVCFSPIEVLYFDLVNVVLGLHKKDKLFLRNLVLLQKPYIQQCIEAIKHFCRIANPEQGEGSAINICCLVKELTVTDTNTLFTILKETSNVVFNVCKKLAHRQIKTNPTFSDIKAMKKKLKSIKYNEIKDSNTVRSYLTKSKPVIKPIEEEIFFLHLNAHKRCEHALCKQQISNDQMVFQLLEPDDYFLATGKRVAWLTSKDIAVLKIYWCFLRFGPFDEENISTPNASITVCRYILYNILAFAETAAYPGYKTLHVLVNAEKSHSTSSDLDLLLCKEITQVAIYTIKHLVSRLQTYSLSMHSILLFCKLIPPPLAWLQFVNNNDNV